MYETPVFNENNEKILCEMGGKNAEMLMTIKVKQLSAGESFTVRAAVRFSTSPIACISRTKRR